MLGTAVFGHRVVCDMDRIVSMMDKSGVLSPAKHECERNAASGLGRFLPLTVGERWPGSR
jgi:hypothetical protein